MPRSRVGATAVAAGSGYGYATRTFPRVQITKVVLAAAHRDHDTSNNDYAKLAALSQRCHMLHDRDEHQRRRWRTLFRRKAMGDLFQGPYPTP